MPDHDYNSKDLLEFPYASALGFTAEELSFLVKDHHTEMLHILDQGGDPQTMDEAFASAAQQMAYAGQPQFTEPVKQTVQKLQRLSKGFAIQAEMLASMIGDAFIASDIKDAVLSPETAPASYPNTLVTSSFVFASAISEYLDKDSWQSNADLGTFLSHAESGMANGHSDYWPFYKTPLVMLYHHHRASVALSVIASELKDQKKHNIANIADALSAKNEAASKELVSYIRSAFDALGQNLETAVSKIATVKR